MTGGSTRRRRALLVTLALGATLAVGGGWAWAAWTERTQLTGRATAAFRPPQLLRAPEVSGTPADGQTLTAVPAAWSGLAPSATRRYVWTRCTTLDPSACATVASGTDAITVPAGVTANWRYAVTETVTNGPHAAAASSVPTPAQTPLAITVPILNVGVRLMAATTAPPTVAGSPQVGSAVTATLGSWSTLDLLSSLTGDLGLGSPTQTYQWYRCGPVGNPTSPSAVAPLGCTAVGSAGATASRTVVAADVGHRLRARVTYQRALLGVLGVTVGTFQGAVFTSATSVVTAP